MLRVLLLVGLATLPVRQAYALANPTTENIEDIWRYNSVATAGDMLLIVHYDLEYTVAPTESISAGWVARLLDVGGAGQLLSTIPLSSPLIPNAGYSHGLYSFYFATAPVVTGVLTVTLEGNPVLNPTPAGKLSSVIETRDASSLEADMREIALHFELLWGQNVITFTGGPGRLTADGENYFTEVIPNLRIYAPGIFSLGFLLPDPEAQLDAPSTTYQTARDTFWTGTPLRNFTTTWSTYFGVSRSILETVLVLVLALLLGGFLYYRWESQELAIFSMVLWINVAAFMGLTPLALPYVMAFTAVFALSYLFFFRPASG